MAVPSAASRSAFALALLTAPRLLLRARRAPIVVLTVAAGCVGVLLLVCLLGRFFGRDNRQIRNAIDGWLEAQRAGATKVENQVHWFGREEEFSTAQAWTIQDITLLNPKHSKHEGDRKLDNMAQARVRVTRLTKGGRRVTQDWDFHLGNTRGTWGIGWVEETKARRWREGLAALAQREGWRLELPSIRFEEESDEEGSVFIKAAHRDLPGVHLMVSTQLGLLPRVSIAVEDDKSKLLARFSLVEHGQVEDENFNRVKALEGQRRVWLEKGRELVRLHYEALDAASR